MPCEGLHKELIALLPLHHRTVIRCRIIIIYMSFSHLPSQNKHRRLPMLDLGGINKQPTSSLTTTTTIQCATTIERRPRHRRYRHRTPPPPSTAATTIDRRHHLRTCRAAHDTTPRCHITDGDVATRRQTMIPSFVVIKCDVDTARQWFIQACHVNVIPQDYEHPCRQDPGPPLTNGNKCPTPQMVNEATPQMVNKATPQMANKAPQPQIVNKATP